MELITMPVLKESPLIIKDIRWDITPKIFMNPSSAPPDESGALVDTTEGYMLYVDLMNDEPALVIMQLQRISSKSVGYVLDIPRDLLRDAMHCADTECIGGMYPLTEKLENWLKKEFALI